MSDTVQDHYTEDDFESLLDDAESNAANDWEEGFVADMKARFQQYGKRMYIDEAHRGARQGASGGADCSAAT